MKNLVKIECAFCHKIFERFPSQSYATYCSMTCRKQFKHQKLELQRHKICQFCGINYYDATKRNVGKSCSKKCANMTMAATRQHNGNYVMSDEQKRKLSEAGHKRFAKQGEKEKMSERLKDVHKNNPNIAIKILASRRSSGRPHWTQTPEGRIKMSKQNTGKKISDEAKTKLSIKARQRVRTLRELNHTSAHGGTRKDLGMYFRSGWEANFARIQNFLKKNWSYEPETFELKPWMSYTPDFLVDDEYVELKGRMTELCEKKINLFRELYPEKTLIVITGVEYNKLRKEYKEKIAWEGK